MKNLSIKKESWGKKKLEEIAKELNPQIRGWYNYYGKYGRHELRQVFRKIQEYLIKHLCKKYKKLKKSKRKGRKLLTRIFKTQRKLFFHWELNISM